MIANLKYNGKGSIRRLDRVLWTYGHLFNDIKKNQSR